MTCIIDDCKNRILLLLAGTPGPAALHMFQPGCGPDGLLFLWLISSVHFSIMHAAVFPFSCLIGE